MSNRTRGLSNKLIGSRAGTMKDSHGNVRLVHITVGNKFAHITTGTHEATFDRGTKGYAQSLKWITKRLGK